jgi:glycosyltransferase involved in cell wall biosynthesis
MHSIILPCFNAALYVEEAIYSVISQIAKDDELIIIDDASTDSSLEVIERSKDSRIRLIKRQKNGGIGVARNDGLKIAQGHYIDFIDADDYWSSHRYEIIQTIIKQHQSPDIISGKVEHFYSPDIDPKSLAHFKLPPVQQAHLPGSVTIRHDLIKKVGYFEPHLKGGEFIDLMAKILREQPLWIKSDAIFLSRRIHLTNYTTLNKDQTREGYLAVIKHHLKRTET